MKNKILHSIFTRENLLALALTLVLIARVVFSKLYPLRTRSPRKKTLKAFSSWTS